MRKKYHNYKDWEDYQAGMFRLDNDPNAVQSSAYLLSDPQRCYDAMLAVVMKWPVAAEHNLTKEDKNRRAWVGQAACCYAVGSPDHATKQAWNLLMTDDTRATANAIADTVIQLWEKDYSNEQTLFG